VQTNAIALAKDNTDPDLDEKNRATLRFEQRDVLQLRSQDLKNVGPFNVIICNPPYIHTKDPSVSRSVRRWEPALALYPIPRPRTATSLEIFFRDEDIFYHKVLSLAAEDVVDKIILMEIGSKDQAIRVIRLANQLRLGPKDIIQIWRDWPDQKPTAGEETNVTIDDKSYTIRGSGLCRSVVIRRFGEPLLV